MGRNYASDTLVTLDATVPHPGFNPFAWRDRRAAIKAELETLDLTVCQWCTASLAFDDIPQPVGERFVLSGRAAELVAELRAL